MTQKTAAHLRCPLSSDGVVRHALTTEHSGIPSTRY